MKRLFYGLAVVVSAILVSGCNKETAEVPNTEQKIAIKTGIEAVARTPQLNEDGSGVFTKGDQFTLLVNNQNDLSTMLDYSEGITELYWKNLQLPSMEGSVDFFACYPTQPLADGCFTFDLATASYKDLLWASTKNVKVGTESVALSFRHAMHRLVVNFSLEDPSYAVADDIETVCTAKSACVVNLIDGTLDNSASGTSAFTSPGGKATFLIVPQDAADVTLDVKVGQDTRRFVLNELPEVPAQLQGGMQFTVDLVVKEGKIELEGTSIEGWGDQGSIDGEIIM